MTSHVLLCTSLEKMQPQSMPSLQPTKITKNIEMISAYLRQGQQGSRSLLARQWDTYQTYQTYHHLAGGAVLRSLTLRRPWSAPGRWEIWKNVRQNISVHVLQTQCSQASADLTQSSGSGNLCSSLRLTMCNRNLDQIWRKVKSDEV